MTGGEEVVVMTLDEVVGWMIREGMVVVDLAGLVAAVGSRRGLRLCLGWTGGGILMRVGGGRM